MSLTSGLNTTTISPFTTQNPNTNSTIPEHDVKMFHRSLGILLVPFFIIALFCVLSGILYYLMKKRRLDQLRHQLVPLYNFDPGEGDDWETEVLEPHVDNKLQKKQHDYQTIDMGSST